MKVSDRRLAQRFRVGIPLRFHLCKSAAGEQTAQSINISERGLYFETASPPGKGTVLRLRIQMPEEVTGVRAAEWQCVGTVVRTDGGRAQGGKIGVAVRLDAYEIDCGPEFAGIAGGHSGQVKRRTRAPKASAEGHRVAASERNEQIQKQLNTEGGTN